MGLLTSAGSVWYRYRCCGRNRLVISLLKAYPASDVDVMWTGHLNVLVSLRLLLVVGSVAGKSLCWRLSHSWATHLIIKRQVLPWEIAVEMPVYRLVWTRITVQFHHPTVTVTRLVKLSIHQILIVTMTRLRFHQMVIVIAGIGWCSGPEHT